MRLRIALVGHAQVGPADAVAARDEATERFVVPRLTANRHAPDAEPRRSRLRRRDRGVERRHVAGDELEDAHLELVARDVATFEDRKSTRLNSSHLGISYAVFCSE